MEVPKSVVRNYRGESFPNIHVLDGGFINLRGSAYLRQDCVSLYDDFLGDLLEDGWAVLADSGCAGVVTAAINGTVTLTTDTTDADKVELAHELNWKTDLDTVIEGRLSLDVLAGGFFLFGLSDAKAEASQVIAFTDVDTPTDVASDGVYIGYQYTATVNTGFVGLSVKAGTPQVVKLNVTPVAATFYELRIVTADERVDFYINKVWKGGLSTAVTKTVALTPYVANKNNSAAAHVVAVDYIAVHQKRS